MEKGFHQRQKQMRKNVKSAYNEIQAILPPLPSSHSTTQQKAMKEVIGDIWSSVITTKCPHCEYQNPAILKDGYTKFFAKSLAEKMKRAQE
jgi:hypothetical protein